METVEQVIDGTLDFGGNITSTISRSGDLLTNMYIKYSPKDLLTYDHSSHTNETRILYPRLSYGLLNEIKLEIGGQEIDRHYAHWLSVREDLFEENELGTLSEINHFATSDSLATRIDPSNGIYSQTMFQRLRDERLMKDARFISEILQLYIYH